MFKFPRSPSARYAAKLGQNGNIARFSTDTAGHLPAFGGIAIPGLSMKLSWWILQRSVSTEVYRYSVIGADIPNTGSPRGMWPPNIEIFVYHKVSHMRIQRLCAITLDYPLFEWVEMARGAFKMNRSQFVRFALDFLKEGIGKGTVLSE